MHILYLIICLLAPLTMKASPELDLKQQQVLQVLRRYVAHQDAEVCGELGVCEQLPAFDFAPIKEKLRAWSKGTQQIVLPAFPFRVGGKGDPQLSETLSLLFLGKFITDLRQIYPKTELLIVADGLLFSDAFGYPDQAIQNYGNALKEQAQLMASGLKILTMDQALAISKKDIKQARDEADALNLLKTPEFVPKLAQLKISHEFVAAGHLIPSATKIQEVFSKIEKRNAYLRAYLRKIFPDALYLTVHGRSSDPHKIPINLFARASALPWRGHAVFSSQGYRIETQKKEGTK